ncbi:MAG TPA: GntR family transcriptional regulator [Ruminococcaceae bacterium]|nr:GntR family transcriptional regulator [Oscillospiraceae bacterium]
MIQLDFQSRVPIYQQLINSFTKLCVTGMLKPDDQLPSVRSLAVELGINPNTIQKAYQQLESQGTIYSVVGKGSFASAHAARAPELLKRAAEKLRLAAGEAAQIGLPKEEALDAVKSAYEEGIK